MFDLIDTSEFKELEYPEELAGSWVNYVFFDHQKPIDGIAIVYFNDKYPSGSVYVSDYILNDYPDVYATWKKRDDSGDVFTDRMFVSPLYRNTGVGTAALSYGSKSLKTLFNKNLQHKYGPENGNRLFAHALNIDRIENDASVQETVGLAKEFYDQPIDPYIFFGKRVLS
jgi:GNAT superfamily N-acetyltransferase